MKRDSNCDPLEPFGNAFKKFFIFKLFLILSFLMALLQLSVTLINSVQQNSNNNNNNNNNNNSNMQMNMNENMNARSLNQDLLFEHRIRTRRFTGIFDLIESVTVPPNIIAKIKGKKDFNHQQFQIKLRNIQNYQRAVVKPIDMRR